MTILDGIAKNQKVFSIQAFVENFPGTPISVFFRRVNNILRFIEIFGFVCTVGQATRLASSVDTAEPHPTPLTHLTTPL